MAGKDKGWWGMSESSVECGWRRRKAAAANQRPGWPSVRSQGAGPLQSARRGRRGTQKKPDRVEGPSREVFLVRRVQRLQLAERVYDGTGLRFI